MTITVLMLVNTIDGQKCMIREEILERYPQASICLPQLNRHEYFFQKNINTTALEVYYHSSLTGISAGIKGNNCKIYGLALLCASIFARCEEIPVRAPWPSEIKLLQLPCYDDCTDALAACQGTSLAAKIDCSSYQSNNITVKSLNTTILCQPVKHIVSEYENIVPACPFGLTFDPRLLSCQLSCPGTDYPEGPRLGMLIVSGWVMTLLAIFCLYLIPPLAYKAYKEPFWREVNSGTRGPTRMISGKLDFLFIIHLLMNAVAYIPYIGIPIEAMWCTDGVFGKAHDNGWVAVLGWCQVVGNFTFVGYWFLILINIWLSIAFQLSVPGGPILWTFIMLLPLVWTYPIMIFAEIVNHVGSVPSLHPIQYFVDETWTDFSMGFIYIPLTIISVLSVPIVLHLCYIVYTWHKREKEFSGSGFEKKSALYIKMLAWYGLYLIPRFMTIGFFWNLFANNAAIGQGYTDKITCAIESIHPTLCQNTDKQSVAWLVFLQVFSLVLLLPVGPIMGFGEKNPNYQFWRILITEHRLIDPSKPLAETMAELSHSAGSKTNASKGSSVIQNVKTNSSDRGDNTASSDA
jgi:hypothetical protein